MHKQHPRIRAVPYDGALIAIESPFRMQYSTQACAKVNTAPFSVASLRSRHRLGFMLAIVLVPAAQAAHAQSHALDADLRAQLQALKEEQGRIDALQQRLDERIRGIEQQLGIAVAPVTVAPQQAQAQPQAPIAAQAHAPAASAANLATATAPASPWSVSGDVRLRHERNFDDGDGPHRNRGAMRGRIAASYQASDWLSIGGRLVTGNLDDPRSAGVTLSNFNDDFQVGLDRLYAQATFGHLTLSGGKFANPFRATPLVWDNDVNPQGVAADYRHSLASGAKLRATGLYFAIDEQSASDDSHMLGGQLGWESAARGHWRYDAAAAYYHYMLDSLAGADNTDFRTNLRRADGSYLSRFHLADLMASVTHTGLGEAWPLRLAGEYVRNLAAATDADTGYSMDLYLGRGSRQGDWRFRYGYSAAQTDAVLAAFSHDDTTIATNYRQHSVAVDYVLLSNTTLNATWYRFRPDDAADAGAFDPGVWLNRVRFNLLVRF